MSEDAHDVEAGLRGHSKPVVDKPKFHPERYIYTHHQVGDRVWDDLTQSQATVIGIQYADGIVNESKSNNHACWGIWIDNDYVGGGRHPWEVTLCDEDGELIWPEGLFPPKEENEAQTQDKPQ